MGPDAAASRAIQYLKQSSLFSELSEEDLSGIDPPPEIVRVTAGETLITQGAIEFDYYVLISGRLAVFVRDREGTIIVRGRVHPGEGVGEMAMLMNEPRSATVVAAFDCELVRFSHLSFLNLIDRHPRASIAIARLTIRRLQEQYKRGKERNTFSTIAVVPVTAGIDALGLAAALARHLAPLGSSVCVGPGLVGMNLTDAPDVGQDARMFELESRHRFTVYPTADASTAWAHHCIRRADLVLLAVDATVGLPPGSGGILPTEELDRDLTGRIDLLLVHGSDWNRSCPTRDWLARTSPTEHHHLRIGNRLDLGRLARIVAGTANNLVLSGGGARSFTEFGALRALAEAGVPIDRIAGTSMGAFVAALFAYRGDFEDFIRRAHDGFRRHRPARDFTLPMLSLLSGKSLAAVAMDICASWQIEDLPVRYFCMSADLGNAREVEHHDGPLWAALRATCALPALGPPMMMGGRVLVDGGVLNNMPVDVMSRHFGGNTIAMNVAAFSPMGYGPAYEMTCPSGFEILRDRLGLRTKAQQVPTIMEILQRSATLSSQARARLSSDKVDFLLTPPIDGFRVAEFHRFDELVEIGYRYTVQALEEAGKDAEIRGKLWPLVAE